MPLIQQNLVHASVAKQLSNQRHIEKNHVKKMKESSYYRKATTVAVFLLTFGSGTVGVCLKDAQCPGDQVCLFKRFQDFKAGKVRIFLVLCILSCIIY